MKGIRTEWGFLGGGEHPNNRLRAGLKRDTMPLRTGPGYGHRIRRAYTPRTEVSFRVVPEVPAGGAGGQHRAVRGADHPRSSRALRFCGGVAGGDAGSYPPVRECPAGCGAGRDRAVGEEHHHPEGVRALPHCQAMPVGRALRERDYFVMSSGPGTTDEMMRWYIKDQRGGAANHQPNLFG